MFLGVPNIAQRYFFCSISLRMFICILDMMFNSLPTFAYHQVYLLEALEGLEALRAGVGVDRG